MKFLKTNLFTILTKFLVIILPFYVIIKVYFDKVLGYSFFGFFIKEFIVILLIISLIYEFIKNKKKPEFDLIDYLIFSFFIYGIIISLINHISFKAIIYGARYDYLGFLIFLIYKHSKDFLEIKIKELIKLFLISASISLFFGLIVKFILGEEVLSLFGYSIYVANFNFNGGIPIYQGVEASGIRRFQGILDSPLSMGVFLILYMGLFSYLNRKNLEYYYFLVIAFLLVLLFLTYSRAALLGVIIAVLFLFGVKFKYLLKKYKKNLVYLFSFLIIIIFSLSYIFQDKLFNVFYRVGSTKGHFERMYNGIKRFEQKPFGAGLATSGPAYRNLVKKITPKTDNYYIPESWFIQILVEGGVIYFWLYILIVFLILKNLYLNKKYYIFATYLAILVMSVFLHIFEYTYLTILLFMFLGGFYKFKRYF